MNRSMVGDVAVGRSYATLDEAFSKRGRLLVVGDVTLGRSYALDSSEERHGRRCCVRSFIRNIRSAI